MKTLSVFLFFALFCVLAIALSIACGDDDDDDDDDDDSGDDDDDGGDDDGPDLGEPGKLNGCVRDFQTKQPVQDALIELLDDSTGEPLADVDGNIIQATSPGGDGCVTLDGIPADQEFIGIKVSRVDYKNTYQFHFINGLEDEEFLLVSESTASLVALSLNIDLNPLRSFAAGALHWGSSTDEHPLGCGKIEFETPPDDGIFYFGIDELPTPEREVTGDVPTNGQGTNPCCQGDPKSFYIGMNQPIGPIDVYAKVPCIEGESFCEEDGDGNWWITRSTIVPKLEADSVTIADIYLTKADFPEDPTPAFCTE
jgi:hypothetical protein